MLIEAIVATALIAICSLGVMGGVLMVEHRTAATLPQAGLAVTAQNVLADIRAATAYDPAELADLAGRSTEFYADEPAPNGTKEHVHITVRIAPADLRGAYVGTVVVSDRTGAAVTVQSALVQEAPAPGSVVPAGQPAQSALQ